jgi:plasmid stability protein
MRTTIDLPADLMQAAKVRAAQHGESLKDLFTRAVAHEVGIRTRSNAGGRLALPLIGRADGPKAELTNADIEAAFEAEDIERYGQ